MQQLIASNPAFQKIREKKEARLQEMTRSIKQLVTAKTIYPVVTIPEWLYLPY